MIYGVLSAHNSTLEDSWVLASRSINTQGEMITQTPAAEGLSRWTQKLLLPLIPGTKKAGQWANVLMRKEQSMVIIPPLSWKSSSINVILEQKPYAIEGALQDQLNIQT